MSGDLTIDGKSQKVTISNNRFHIILIGVKIKHTVVDFSLQISIDVMKDHTHGSIRSKILKIINITFQFTSQTYGFQLKLTAKS